MLILFVIFIFFIASFLSVYSYGRFAKRAKGEASYTLPIDDKLTSLDRILDPELKQHPDESCLMLIPSNLDAFAIRANTTRTAERSLDLQYYIWNDDITGRLLCHELLAAAERGVRVRLLLDDMNIRKNKKMFTALNRHENIEIRLFNPTRIRKNRLMRGIEMLLRFFSINRRMHNKAWIVDGRVAIVGGRNIGDEYFDASVDRRFFDVDLLVSGPAVNEACSIFDHFWNSDVVIPLAALSKGSKRAFKRLLKKIHASQESLFALPYIKTLQETPSVQAIFNGEWTVHWSKHIHIDSDPVEKVFDLQQAQWLLPIISQTLSTTTQKLSVISPYFVPGEQGMAIFIDLRHKGADINILTNSLAATDVLAVHGGYKRYRKPLLQQNIALYELKPFGDTERSLLGSRGASLHTKAFLVDNAMGFVGSFNFDPRSAMLNTEMGVLFEEPRIVKELQQELDKRSGINYSYKLALQNGQIIWQDIAKDLQPYYWTHEPHTTIWQRFLAKVISYLPIESQL